MAVGGVEGASDLVDDLHRPAGLEPPHLTEQLAEVYAGNEAHRDEEDAVVVAHGMNGDHVGMLDLGGDRRLTLEAGAEVRVAGQFRCDHLECDDAVGTLLVGPVDDAHPAASGDRLDHEAADLVTRGERTAWTFRQLRLLEPVRVTRAPPYTRHRRPTTRVTRFLGVAGRELAPGDPRAGPTRSTRPRRTSDDRAHPPGSPVSRCRRHRQPGGRGARPRRAGRRPHGGGRPAASDLPGE